MMSIDHSTFSIDRSGYLVRAVTPKRGTPYEHRCSLETFETVAHWIAEQGDRAWAGEEIVKGEGLPNSQVFVALGFLHERGIIDRERRLNFAVNPGGVHLDAMTEWHALREKA